MMRRTLARNNNKQTPLHLAIENGHSEFAVLMVKSMELGRWASAKFIIIDLLDAHSNLVLLKR